MKQLTRAEEEVMQVLWGINQAFVKDILEHYPDPKPAYNTISTIIRILEQKGFVGHEAFGRSHQYFPLVKKADYTQASAKHLVSNYFNGSYQNMLSFFVKDKKISVSELEDIINQTKEK